MEYWDPEKHSFARAESLLEALGFADWHSLPRVVSLVGAGGKTSTMYDLAGELADRGARVLVTTSTHIFKPDQYETGFLGRINRTGKNTGWRKDESLPPESGRKKKEERGSFACRRIWEKRR